MLPSLGIFGQHAANTNNEAALKILSGIGGAVAYGTNVEGSEFLHYFIATSVKRFVRR